MNAQAKKAAQVAELKSMPATDKGVISITTQPNGVVECNLTVKPEQKSPVKYQMKWLFDFTGCSDVEIREIAANYLKIRVQDSWRKDPTYKDVNWNERVFNVKSDILNKQRVGGSNPQKRVQKLVASMTPEQKAELLAQLTQ